MKKELIVFILMFTCFVQCKVRNSNKIIQYVLPYQVELALTNQIQTKENHHLIFFSMSKNGENHVVILIQCTREELKKMDKFNMVANSSRFLILGNKFYLLLFDYDYKFATKLTKKSLRSSVQERWNNESFGIPRSSPIYDGAFTLKFNKNGDIVSD
jgi:hypothetical protein